MASTQDNKDVIRKIYQAMAAGDRAPFGEAVRDDYVWRLPGRSSWSRRFETREVVQRDLLKPLFALFAGAYRAECINLIAEGDWVVAEVRGEVVTRRGELYDNAYCFLFRFRDGKIAEIVEYGDTDLLERVLGPYEAALAAVAV